jgi:hypothetical protein
MSASFPSASSAVDGGEMRRFGGSGTVVFVLLRCPAGLSTAGYLVPFGFLWVQFGANEGDWNGGGGVPLFMTSICRV